MKIFSNAFYFGNEVNATDAKFPEFFAMLAQQNGTIPWPFYLEHVEGMFNRELYVNELPDCWCGVIASSRGTDNHHRRRRVGNKVIFETGVRTGEPNFEVNFFCIRKDSYKGIYSSHHGSYAFTLFLRELWHTYRWFTEGKCKSRIQALPAGTSESAKERIAEEYAVRGKAKYAALYTPERFAAKINAMRSVEEVRLTTYEVESPADQPVSGRIKQVHSAFTFEEGKGVMDSQLFRWILRKKFRTQHELKSGKQSYNGTVIGTDHDGNPSIVPFSAKLDDHLNIEYKDIQQFESDRIGETICVTAMLAKVQTEILFRP